MKNVKSTCCNEEAVHFIDGKYICSSCNRRCSTYNRVAFRKFIIGSFAIVLLSLIFFQNTHLNIHRINKKSKHIESKFKDVQLNDSSISNRLIDVQLNDSSITNKLIELDCILPNVALAQIKQETGHYKSSLTYTHKNIAGIMKGNKYKKYDTYEACLVDYIRIQDMYLRQIHKKYAEDTTYIYKLKYIK